MRKPRCGRTFTLKLPKKFMTFDGLLPHGKLPQNQITRAVNREVTQHLERVLWVVTKTYGDNYYDIQKGSSLVMEFNFETGQLDFVNSTYSYDNPTRHIRVWNQTGRKLEIGTTCRITYRNANTTQKPEIIAVLGMPFGQKTAPDTPNPPVPGLQTTPWPQSMGSIRKDWLGNTAIDFSSSELDVAQKDNADWPSLFTFAGDPHILKGTDAFWPSILVMDEFYTNIPDADAQNHVQTLALMTNKRNGFQIQGQLNLYRLTGSDPRTEVSSMLSNDEAILPFPYNASWTFNFDPVSPIFLPYVSNGYARAYNPTIFPTDGDTNFETTERVHFTFLQPCVIKGSTGLADDTSASYTTIDEQIDVYLDGSTYILPLAHTVHEVISVHSGDGTQPLEDQFVSYTLLDTNLAVSVESQVQLDEESNPILGSFWIQYTYLEGGPSQFQVMEVALTRKSTEFVSVLNQVMPSLQTNAVHHEDPEDNRLPGTWSWPGYMGSAHVSIANNVMIQAHIASDKVHLNHRPLTIDPDYYGWMFWIPRYTATWEVLVPEVDNIQTLPAWKFFNMSGMTNNAPAKIIDANLYPRMVDGSEVAAETELLGDSFVLPYFTFYGEKFPTDMSNYGGTFTSKYWYVKLMMRDNGTTATEAIKILERTNPASGDVLALTSLDGLVEADIKTQIETSNGIILDHLYTVERYHSYGCPVVTDCIFEGGAWGPNVSGCADPCWIDYACNEDPNSHGCFCWNYDSQSILLGVNQTLIKWGGYLEGSITDFYGTQYPPSSTPEPEKQGLNNVIIPLPLNLPNQSGNDLSKCSWTARSKGTGAGTENWVKDSVDPQVVVSDVDGMIYSCVIEGKFIRVPTGGYFYITTNEASGAGGEGSGSGGWDGGPSTPDPGQELCRMNYTYTEFYAVAGGCENCMLGERDPESGLGGWNYFVPPEPRSIVVTLPPTAVPGNTYSETTYYAYREIKEVRETKLVISNKAGTSVLAVPISKTFTNIPYVTSTSVNSYVIPDALPVPENVWQLGLWKGFILILIDDRDQFSYSPRPILQIRNRFTGAVVAEYKTLVPDDLYNTRWPSDDPFRADMTKWVMHGRFTNQGFFGPRFKLTHMTDTSAEGDENKPLYIHLSAEIYSVPEATNVDFVSTSRVEYRILKFDGTDLTEVKSAFEAKEQNFLAGHSLDAEIQFGEKYPRPGALGSMAVTRGEVFLPVISSAVGDEDTKTWTLLSHQV